MRHILRFLPGAPERWGTILDMRTFGGRRALTHVCALVALSLPAALLTGCSAALDQAHSVQTKLGRVDEIVDCLGRHSVRGHRRRDRGDLHRRDDTARELAALLAEIDKVADEADYPSYRLDLTPAGAPGDRLTVDDTFVDSADRSVVLDNWFSVTDRAPRRRAVLLRAGHRVDLRRLRAGRRSTTSAR